MKNKLYLILLLISIPCRGLAQWIDSLWVVPSNPTTTDTIHLFAKCSFGSGTCNNHTQFISVTPPVISANALHCLGILTYICDHTDTFQINPLAAGPYTFIFQVNEGLLPSPCSPGIVPGPVDSIVFHVSDVSGISSPNEEEIQIISGIEKGVFEVFIPSLFLNSKPLWFNIYNLQGQLMDSFVTNKQKTEINLSKLASGNYFIQLMDNQKVKRAQKICIQ